MSEDIHWSFLHEGSGRQVDGLSLAQATFVYSVIPRSERKFYLVWHQGLPEWERLEDCKYFVEEDPHPAFDFSELDTATAAESVLKSLDLKTAKPQDNFEAEKRGTKRFAKMYKVEIRLADNKVFASRTVDISLGGMQLKDALPLELSKTFEVVLSRMNGTSLKIFCSMIRIPKSTTPTKRLRIIGTNQEGMFRNWLLEASAE